VFDENINYRLESRLICLLFKQVSTINSFLLFFLLNNLTENQYFIWVSDFISKQKSIYCIWHWRNYKKKKRMNKKIRLIFFFFRYYYKYAYIHTILLTDIKKRRRLDLLPSKMLLFSICFILFFNKFIQTLPVVDNQNEGNPFRVIILFDWFIIEDITASLARLHNEVNRIRQHLNPIPDLITFASNDIAPRLKRYIQTKQTNENEQYFYGNFRSDSTEDELQTKYINLYIDTERDFNENYKDLDEDQDYLDTKIVYLNIDSSPNDKFYPSFPHYRRRRRQIEWNKKSARAYPYE